MGEATLFSGIARLEKLATTYGQVVTNMVSTVADNLSGPGAPSSNSYNAGGASQQAGPNAVASHLGTRLHDVASLLEALFGRVETHASRSASAIGVGIAKG